MVTIPTVKSNDMTTEQHYLDTHRPLTAEQGFDELIAASEGYEARKTDHLGTPGAITWADGQLVFDAPGSPLFKDSREHAVLDVTPWAFRQVTDKLGKALFGEGSNHALDREDWWALKGNFTPQFDLVFNVLMDELKRQTPDDNLLVRAYRRPTLAGDLDICRAFLSGRYAPVSSTNILKAVWDGLRPDWKRGDIPDLKVNKSIVTPDEMNLYTVFKNPPQTGGWNGDGNYGVGVFIGNGETGNRSLQVSGLIQRHSCSNSILITTDYNIRLRHLGDGAALQTALLAAAITMMPVAAETLNRVMEAERRALPSFGDVLKGLGKQYGWSEDQTRQVAIGTEGAESVMGVVNGVSYMAHTSKLSPQEQVEAEHLAGTLLVAPDSLFHRAAKMVQREDIQVAVR